MTSIRFRLISTYLLIIWLTVVLVEFGVYSLINNYYITNIETILKSEQDMCVDLYEQLYHNQDLFSESEAIASKLIGYTKAQVQLIDVEGRVLYDSIEQYKRGETIETSDVSMALEEGIGDWQGNIDTGEAVFALSQSLMDGDQVVGIIRFVTSLEESNGVVNQLMAVLLSAGVVIIIIVFLASLFMANSIIKPIQNLEDYAKEIAKGNYQKRIEIANNDEIGRLTENLNYMANELKRTETMKDQFIGSISHELRTPLTSIKGWIVTLRTDHSKDPILMDEGYSIIESETDRLTDLVNELLDFSKLQSHQLSVRREPMDIAELLDYVYKQMRPRAQRKQIDLSYKMPEGPVVIDGDYNRLKQVFINIIDNAFKYTPELGTISILCSGSSWCCRIEISDSGCGIDEEALPEVFNRYYQGENAVEGGGIGLTLCKEIVSLHGGTIEIESEKGTGTLVRVLLPIVDEKVEEGVI